MGVGRRPARHDLPHRFGAGHARHVEIHGDDVGAEARDHVDGLRTIFGLTDHHHLVIDLQDLAHGLPHEQRIVDHEHLDHERSSWST
jgi:hypothetical protein